MDGTRPSARFVVSLSLSTSIMSIIRLHVNVCSTVTTLCHNHYTVCLWIGRCEAAHPAGRLQNSSICISARRSHADRRRHAALRAQAAWHAVS